jgi:hypothetical protein
MKKTTPLRDAALALLKKHSTPDAAVKPFADVIEKDGALRHALALEFLTSLAPKGATSRRRLGRHRRVSPIAKLPSESQKKANLSAAKSYAHEIFSRRLRGGKLLGDIRINELRAYARASADVAGQFIQRGYEDAVDLFACVRLAGHCQAADPDAVVRDTIKPAAVVEIYQQARIDAAEEIAMRGTTLAQELMTAATTRSQIQIEHRP